ncbi:MAG: hypothetical protein NTX17_03810 [Candidatus Eisenbacteria bacterium]|nr:hypothetical protein [Candidatus Eisenbacteria bacterium]
MSGTTESILVGLGIGLVVLAVSMAIKPVPRRAAILMAVGTGIIAFVLWPRAVLVEVPDLSDLSRDEAELELSSAKLDGAPQPQEAPNTRPDHVVPMSQSPLPETKVHRGTLVRYSISTPTSTVSGKATDSDSTRGHVLVSIFSPRHGGEVVPVRGADNIFRFDVEGTLEGVDLARYSLLLWVQPVAPPSDQPGWYLQRLPANGVRSISGNRWSGVCQIGNQQYPPNEGDMLEVVASVVPAGEAERLEARQGPLTAVVVPGSVSQVVRVKVRLK